MALIEDISVIDTMIGFKDADSGHYVPPSVRQEDKGEQHVADYMFTDVPATEDQVGAVQRTLDAMDANRVGMGLVALMGTHALNAARNYPDRFFCALTSTPLTLWKLSRKSTLSTRSMRREQFLFSQQEISRKSQLTTQKCIQSMLLALT